MYQVRHEKDERWVVLDLNDQPVFTGTRRECEDWLDGQENAARHERVPRSPGLLKRVWSRLVSGRRKARGREPGDRAAAESDIAAR